MHLYWNNSWASWSCIPYSHEQNDFGNNGISMAKVIQTLGALLSLQRILWVQFLGFKANHSDFLHLFSFPRLCGPGKNLLCRLRFYWTQRCIFAPLLLALPHWPGLRSCGKQQRRKMWHLNPPGWTMQLGGNNKSRTKGPLSPTWTFLVFFLELRDQRYGRSDMEHKV